MNTVDCACLIHGNKYQWSYVDTLYNMVSTNVNMNVRFHVFTEASRGVPAPYIKHELVDWPGISGPRQSWWYKLQLFNTKNFQGQLLYLDLDTVIFGNIDWIWGVSPDNFWTIKDFKHMWRPWNGINSSIMLWNTEKFSYVWDHFLTQDLSDLVRKYPGDQDYLSAVLNTKDIKFFDENLVKSWRWQLLDGGLDFKTRRYRRPGAGTLLDPNTRIAVFHGNPKPHEVTDPVIQKYWTKHK